MTATIERISAREILDSRGDPTIEAIVELSTGDEVRDAVPAGASTGTHEARELRDGGSRFAGRGESKAVENVKTTINAALRGAKVTDQQSIDRHLIEIDGTPDRSHLGANAMLGVSLACARGGSRVTKKPLYRYLRDCFSIADPQTFPRPMCNIINGGRHADNNVSFQEYLVLPSGTTCAQQIERTWAVIHSLKNLLVERKERTTVGDEGGFAPMLASNEEGLAMIERAITTAGLSFGSDVALGIDAAASEFYNAHDDSYTLKPEQKRYTGDELIPLYQTLIERYQLRTIEDPLAEDDLIHWTALTQAIGSKVLLIGDDLFATHKDRLLDGIRVHAANAILIKPNQVGTLTETMETVETARKAGYAFIVSHRSGETNDDFIADLAAAIGSPYLKAGSLAHEERLVKYNRLLEIAQEVGA